MIRHGKWFSFFVFKRTIHIFLIRFNCSLFSFFCCCCIFLLSECLTLKNKTIFKINLDMKRDRISCWGGNIIIFMKIICCWMRIFSFLLDTKNNINRKIKAVLIRCATDKEMKMGVSIFYLFFKQANNNNN